jgi:hypothetical protein
MKSRRSREFAKVLCTSPKVECPPLAILYDANDAARVVTVQVIGEKRGNRMIVQGKEFTEHESH